MAVLNNSALVGASGKGGGALPQRSLRFSSADSSQLSRTPSVAGNRKTWTWSGWVKLCAIPSSYFMLFSAGTGGSDTGLIRLNYENSGKLNLAAWNTDPIIRTAAVYRDFSAWYHIVVAVDTANATASNRAKIYINGIEATYDSDNRSSISNLDTPWNNNVTHAIGTGSWAAGSSYYANAYIAHVHSLDGIAATPSAFAYTDPVTGRWEPKAYEGSYSGNSFYLDFSDDSAATATTLGKDRSGLNNNWVPNNLAVPPSVVYKDPNFSVGAMTAGGTDYPPSVMFSGNLALGWGAGMSPRTNKYVLTNAVSIPAGNLEVYSSGGPGDYGGWWYVTIINSAGTSFVSPNINTNTPAWYSLGSSIGNIKEIWHTFYGNGPDWAYAGGAIYGFRVGSQLFVSTENYTFNDSLRDHPVSAGTDGGLGGQVSGNYATLNPLQLTSGTNAPKNGNLDWVRGGSQSYGAVSTIAMVSGKYYWECTVTNVGDTNYGVGLLAQDATGGMRDGQVAASYAGMYQSGGTVRKNNNAVATYATYSTGDVIGVAYDADTRNLTFYKNGSSQGTLALDVPTAPYVAWVFLYANTSTSASVNFGQRRWAYQAPAGFKALCDTNLNAPTIVKPNTVMDVALWSGNSGSQSITLPGSFNPDFVWVKSRSNGAYNHIAIDAVRGSSAIVHPNLTNAEFSNSNYITAFNSNGFTLGSSTDINGSGNTFVGWCFDAGSSAAATNNSGSIQSTAKTNTTSGFAVVTYTTTGSAGTIGHGLNSAPLFIITKQRNGTTAWYTYHASIGASNYLLLNSTAASAASSGIWNNTAPTSNVFSIGSGFGNGETYVAYCFAPVAGYSAMGSWVASDSGNFVYTGFRPAFLLAKNISVGDGNGTWIIRDNKRGATTNGNPTTYTLFPQSSDAERDDFYDAIDFVSNGFVVKAGTGNFSNYAGTHIYYAVAEAPFQYARAK